MPENPYINVIFVAVMTVAFILVTSYGLGALAGWIAKKAGAPRSRQQSTFAGYLFAAPWIVGFLIFVVVPMGFCLYWSFTDYRVTSPQAPNWLGLENYRALLFEDSTFRASIVNTLYLTAIGLPL